MNPPEGYRHTAHFEVRFADLDAMGHLNHAKFLTYMEQARIDYVQQVCGWQGDWHTLGMILAQATIDYRLPIFYGDAVSVFTRCVRLGSKSFDLQYQIWRQRPQQAEELAAEARTVMVAYDYASDQTIPVPQTWRAAMQAYEPAVIAG